MKQVSRVLTGLLIAGICVGLPSCKEDEPPAKPKLGFAEKELTIKESEGEIEIKIVLDKPASEDIEIEYTLKGTAVEEVTANSQGAAADYKITTDYLKVEIEAGQSEGIIGISLYSDAYLEDDETIEIAIDDVDGDVEITRDDDMSITLEQEDGLLVVLAWGVGTGERYNDVDMDLFLWAQGTDGNLGLTSFGSLSTSVVSPEYFFLPPNGIKDGTYGLSCNYYSGSVDPMNFQVSYIKVVNGSTGSTVVKKGTYTKVNINPWDDEATGIDPVLIMTFKKAGSDFTEFSDITIPSAGSRLLSGKIPPGIKKTN